MRCTDCLTYLNYLVNTAFLASKHWESGESVENCVQFATYSTRLHGKRVTCTVRCVFLDFYYILIYFCRNPGINPGEIDSLKWLTSMRSADKHQLQFS